MQAMEISRTALDVEWRRLEIIAMNLANINSADSAGATPYVPQRLVSGPRASFASYLQTASDTGSDPAIDLRSLGGVEVQRIESTGSTRVVHEPTNPRADANGFVSYGNVDHAEQMTLLIKASRAYEANIVAMNAARQMYTKALELGRPA